MSITEREYIMNYKYTVLGEDGLVDIDLTLINRKMHEAREWYDENKNIVTEGKFYRVVVEDSGDILDCSNVNDIDANGFFSVKPDKTKISEIKKSVKEIFNGYYSGHCEDCRKSGEKPYSQKQFKIEESWLQYVEVYSVDKLDTVSKCGKIEF